jgi:hypothetical protein
MRKRKGKEEDYSFSLSGECELCGVFSFPCSRPGSTVVVFSAHAPPEKSWTPTMAKKKNPPKGRGECCTFCSEYNCKSCVFDLYFLFIYLMLV